MGVLDELDRKGAAATSVTAVLDSAQAKPPGLGKRFLQGQVKSLPIYGGALGGALGLTQPEIGGPIGGAMLGATGGKALEQAISPYVGLEAPQIVQEPLRALGEQASAATVQGLTEGAPMAVQAGVQAVGKKFATTQMAKALAPAKSLVRSFPNLVANALKQRATVGTVFGKGGQAEAQATRQAATARVNALLKTATRRGGQFDVEMVARPAVETMERKLRRKLTEEEYANLIGLVQSRTDELMTRSVFNAARRPQVSPQTISWEDRFQLFGGGRSAPPTPQPVNRVMNPLEADELRKAASRSAQGTLTAESMGLPTTAIPDLDRHIARGASDAVKTIRGVRTARQAEQAAIGVSRAVRESEIRPAPPGVAVGLGPLKAGFSLPPELTSRMALMGLATSQYPLIAPILQALLRTGQYGMAQR